VQREINEKRQELLAKEESLRLVSKVKARCHVTKGSPQEPGESTCGSGLTGRVPRRGLWRVVRVDYGDVVYPEALIVSACTLV
jgi:hypothetical protein